MVNSQKRQKREQNQLGFRAIAITIMSDEPTSEASQDMKRELSFAVDSIPEDGDSYALKPTMKDENEEVNS